jgi:integration host factor subunit beta
MESKENSRYRADIVEKLVAQNPELKKEEIEQMLDLIIVEMSTGLSCGDRIEIRGFGSMSIRNRKANDSKRNPRSGAKVMVGDRPAIYFRPSKSFITKLNATPANNN